MVNYLELYNKYLDKFKEKIKGEYILKLFPEGPDKGIDLKTAHTKFNQDPEALTSDIIRELLRECKIDPLDIARETVIEGSNIVFKKVKKKPDFFIESGDPDVNGLLFEIEHLNKVLDKEGDREGIEQAREWYSIKPALFNQYDSIITDFKKWFLLKCDKDKEDFVKIPLKPWDALEFIVDRKYGKSKEYLFEQVEEKKSEITNVFYSGFQERLKKLLKKPSKVLINIEFQNYKRSEGQNDAEFEISLIRYYRTIFSRLLFVKILESWKMLSLDPLKEIFKGDKWHWNSDLRSLFFEVFNMPVKKRTKNLPDFFKRLPYLNGGLFRRSGIEKDDKGNPRDVQLNPEAIKDIWDFFNGYRFLREGNNIVSDSTTINPEILGYIFERSIGDERKLTGSYYTREEITNYMVENTLFRYIVDKVNEFLSDRKIKVISKISDIDFLEISVDVYEFLLKDVLVSLKICDPACGSGAFLEKTAEKLLYLYKKCYKGCGRALTYRLTEGKKVDSQMPFSDIYSIKKNIIQVNLYGVDINPSAIEICELRLWLWVVKPPESMMFDSDSFELLPLPNIEYNLRCGNSLIGYQRIRPKKNRRIDESLFFDILNKKEELIKKYYSTEENLTEVEKEDARIEIDKIIEESKEKLNKLLLSDYQKRNFKIEAKVIQISELIKTDNYRKALYDEISKLNKESTLSRFKVNFLNPTSEDIKPVSGITLSKVKKTSNIRSIYTTSKFNFGYYSEYGDYPLSKFIVGMISKWADVQTIEFEKLIDLNDMKKINPFHWFMEFSEVLGEDESNKKGFNIIIGNPPFIRIENIDEPERELYKRDYELAEKRFDIFILFYELCNKILKVQGYLSFVSSNKFLKSQTAKNMRRFLSSNFSIKEILNFNNYNAFHGVIIKTLLIFLKKSLKQNRFPYISIDNKSFILTAVAMNSINIVKAEERQQADFLIYMIDGANIDDGNWEFYPKIVKQIIEKIESSTSLKLIDLIKSNRQGVVTSANPVFIASEKTIKDNGIESEFVYKIVKGEEIRRWQKIAWDDKYLIYPYRYDPKTEKREKIDIDKENELKISKYLIKFKDKLVNRYCVNSGNKDWFELHDPVSPRYFLGKKLMFPDISLVPSFSIDYSGDLFSLDTNYSIIPENENHLYFLMAILNSFILEIYIRYKFQTLAKEFRFKTFLVNEIPILHPEELNKNKFNKINELSEKLFNKYDVNLEKELNLLFKDLYDLSDEEYAFVTQIINKYHSIEF